MDAKYRAVEDIRKLGKMFKGLLDFSEELEKVGSLELAANEVQARYDRLVKEEEELKGSVQSAKAEVLASKELAKANLDNAERAVSDSVGEAGREAHTIRGIAKDAAEKIIADAKAESDHIRTSIADAKDKLKDVEDQIKEREAVLLELNSKLNDIRTRVG